MLRDVRVGGVFDKKKAPPKRGRQCCINQEERIDTGETSPSNQLGTPRRAFKAAAGRRWSRPTAGPAIAAQFARFTLPFDAALTAVAVAARTLASAKSTTCFVAFWN